jgi:hypothetical protein
MVWNNFSNKLILILFFYQNILGLEIGVRKWGIEKKVRKFTN